MRESTKMPFLLEEKCSCTSMAMAIVTFDWGKPIKSVFYPKAKRARIVGRLNRGTSLLWCARTKIWRRQWSSFECHTTILPATEAHEKINTIPFHHLCIRANHG